jgi:hypothetical protein
MRCTVCMDLERAFESKRLECVKVLAGPYYHFSDRFIAYANVEMERARSDLDRHRSVCVLAIREGWHKIPPSLNKDWVPDARRK